ncbi:hypothetical protein LSH36_203g00014 [Paralvinella palmiformis]|uniref:Aminopeptidase n=1 Tax=Paralvinella palmiformis TaxID=53620 RepID=A0AAD9N4J2_9ANNE|nr:hypothetical protein LSH36_203g00014 [Paralvinella palmiformis]
MVEREQFTFDGMDNDVVVLEQKKRGIYISPLVLVVYVLVTIFLSVAVGVIVHFVKPCTHDQSESADRHSPEGVSVDGCPVTTLSTVTSSSIGDDDLWMVCLNMSLSRNETLPCPVSCHQTTPGEVINYRLPPTFLPRHYNIDIKPDIYGKEFLYQGRVVIHLECTERSDVIFVHFRKMTIEQPIDVRSADVIIGVIKTETVNVTELFKIYLDRPIEVGENISVSISYHGEVLADMVGMYYSRYVEENATKFMLATQLQATDARKAFPCLDEPLLKATFELRHWSRPEFIEKGYVNYSLDIGLKIFDYFENYFDYPYDMPKEDQISVPDFAFGAMENWGLIVYRETRMWLGNVVTCAWWSDLWLNEGMARYHEYLAMKAVQPDWDVDQIFAAQVIYTALASDQLGHSYPVHNPVEKPNEIERMFNSITYNKAGCVIRMLKELLLKDSYQDAMRLYLRQNAYDSVTFVELLRAFDDQAKKDDIPVNASMMMATWITQMGYPLVTMEKINNNTIKITQKMFLQNPQRPLYEAYTPPFKSLSLNNFIPETIKLQHPLSSSDWLLGNYLQYGLYRVNYDIVNWNLLISQLKSNHKVFHVVNRGQLIQDSFNLGRSGDLDHVISLRVTEYLRDETDHLPWVAAAEEAFEFFQKIFRYSANFPLFRTYARNLMLKNYKTLGWKKRLEDTHHDVYLRELTTKYSCIYGNTDCIETALDYFRRWKDDPTNTTIIDPNIRNTVYCTAIHYGLPSDWDFLFNIYKNFQHFSNEKSRQCRALTCSSDRATLARFFQMAASNNEEIMSHDPEGAITIMRYIAKTSVGHYIAWEALDAQWDTMRSKHTIFSSLCESLSTQYDLERFEAFISKHPPKKENEKNSTEDARNLILHNMRWRAANENAIFQWLRNVH